MKDTRSLRDRAEQSRARVMLAKMNPRLTDEYKADFEAAQIKIVEEECAATRAEITARAELMRTAAEETYLSDQIRGREKMILFRDYIAAAGTDALRSLAPLTPAKVLALAAELRRRGEDADADALMEERQHTGEPWTELGQWKEADELMEPFAEMDAANRIAREKGEPPACYLVTEDGDLITLADFFAEQLTDESTEAPATQAEREALQ